LNSLHFSNSLFEWSNWNIIYFKFLVWIKQFNFHFKANWTLSLNPSWVCLIFDPIQLISTFDPSRPQRFNMNWLGPTFSPGWFASPSTKVDDFNVQLRPTQLDLRCVGLKFKVVAHFCWGRTFRDQWYNEMRLRCGILERAIQWCQEVHPAVYNLPTMQIWHRSDSWFTSTSSRS